MEVADIFRDHGLAWRQANADHISLEQLKVMSAIERYRTAALGAKQSEISVPGEVSVVGFDGIDLASVTEPPLTTIHVPHRRMGQAAAELLLAIRSGATNVQGVEFRPEVIVRGSLAAPRQP